jgi:hypothetical protein
MQYLIEMVVEDVPIQAYRAILVAFHATKDFLCLLTSYFRVVVVTLMQHILYLPYIVGNDVVGVIGFQMFD